jgi:iron-sulfur cluster assembly protein
MTEALPAVTLTAKAARRVQALLEKRGGLGMRIAVKTSGCSGMAYALEFADAEQEGDLRCESHGVTLLVDARSLPYLRGTELDFVREGLNEGFKFHNPNAKNECGCGESFTV